MVAEPVQATVQTLKQLYSQATGFIDTQYDNVVNSDLYNNSYDKITKLNPFGETNGSIISIGNPPPPSPPPSPSHSAYGACSRMYQKVYDSINENRARYITLFSCVGLGGAAWLIYKRRKRNLSDSAEKRHKRRVPKLTNGARRDVVLIIGSPTEPLTRLIALDFEKRGFIVYLTILDENDSKYIESNPITDDVNYLNLNDKKGNMETHVSTFNQLLKLPVVPFPGAEAHTLNLVGVVFAPSLYFPIGPIENIAISSWAKLNDRVMTYLKLLSSGLIQLVRTQQAKLILVNPNILSALDMPYHAPESIFQNQLKHLFTTLTRELSSHGISVTQVRLGNLHISNQKLSSGPRIESLVNTEVRAWTSEMKQLYSDDFSRSQFKANPIKSTGGKGTSLRELYHLLFDLLYSEKRNPPVVYCGTGARGYDLICRIFPESWIEWFLK
ncbi:uncharacterized protein SPAPADRAFT_59401 [Spathaspora passalidarum NRRL Y-27907]|uniref:DUF1776-domain-containing protein n=1 Tax=Spathaspora passalidarum (strain NRRL Y-27907 / 11-Y1) TaxID=619300 RepID=G3AJU3_SPAPN|nr:uncharacterized protein SPAPADRAFT_59401 [Spathaspora passalidarum NRRL Y-27907]EGW33994.1 hypothetical protein SPAPADRAFT_59401 [Spathaspora passalidarum NRRL Y-27907]